MNGELKRKDVIFCTALIISIVYYTSGHQFMSWFYMILSILILLEII